MRCDNSDFPERAAWCNDYFACGGCQPVGTAARLAVGNGHRLFHRARIEDVPLNVFTSKKVFSIRHDRSVRDPFAHRLTFGLLDDTQKGLTSLD
jgi:hypothetical protein